MQNAQEARYNWPEYPTSRDGIWSRAKRGLVGDVPIPGLGTVTVDPNVAVGSIRARTTVGVIVGMTKGLTALINCSSGTAATIVAVVVVIGAGVTAGKNLVTTTGDPLRTVGADITVGVKGAGAPLGATLERAEADG